MKKNLFAITYNFICIILMTMTNAHAYFDPGVGSMLIQVLAAAALAIGLCWKFIIAFFRKVFKKKKNGENTDSEGDDYTDDTENND